MGRVKFRQLTGDSSYEAIRLILEKFETHLLRQLNESRTKIATRVATQIYAKYPWLVGITVEIGYLHLRNSVFLHGNLFPRFLIKDFPEEIAWQSLTCHDLVVIPPRLKGAQPQVYCFKPTVPITPELQAALEELTRKVELVCAEAHQMALEIVAEESDDPLIRWVEENFEFWHTGAMVSRGSI